MNRLMIEDIEDRVRQAHSRWIKALEHWVSGLGKRSNEDKIEAEAIVDNAYTELRRWKRVLARARNGEYDERVDPIIAVLER